MTTSHLYRFLCSNIFFGSYSGTLSCGIMRRYMRTLRGVETSTSKDFLFVPLGGFLGKFTFRGSSGKILRVTIFVSCKHMQNKIYRSTYDKGRPHLVFLHMLPRDRKELWELLDGNEIPVQSHILSLNRPIKQTTPHDIAISL